MRKLIKKLGIERPSDWNEKLFFPVIHLPEYNLAFEAAYRETSIAHKAGADGAILISHGSLSTDQLSEVWESTQEQFARFPVGINWLSLTHRPGEMIERASELGVKLLWSDNWECQEEVESARQRTGWDGAYCGAVAFKVGPYVPLDKIPAELERAYGYMDLPITSGPGTGRAIDLEKAAVFHEAAQGRALGIASGVDAENIHSLLPIFNVFQVSTSLSKDNDFYRHDSRKTEQMAKAIKSYHP